MDFEFIYNTETKDNIYKILENIYAEFVETTFKDLLTTNLTND